MLLSLLSATAQFQAETSASKFLIIGSANIEYLTTRGDFTHAEWSDAAKANLMSAVARDVRDRGGVATSLDDDCEASLLIGQSILLASTVSMSADEALPHLYSSERNPDLTIGDFAINALQACEPFDQLIIVSHEGRVISSGTILAGVALAALTGFNADRDGSDTTTLSIFDGETGQLVHHVRTVNSDPRTSTAALRIARDLIRLSGVFIDE